MKLLLENFKKYINEEIEMQEEEEDLNTQVALKIARMGLRGTALGMSDKNLKDLVVAIYDEHFDETGEGWNPYDDDLGHIRDVLTPSDEEDEDHYNLEEMIQEEVNLFLEKRKKKRKKRKKKSSGGKKLDRCARIAKRKYDVWPSAYASGAAVKCRKGKIWKNEK